MTEQKPMSTPRQISCLAIALLEFWVVVNATTFGSKGAMNVVAFLMFLGLITSPISLKLVAEAKEKDARWEWLLALVTALDFISVGFLAWAGFPWIASAWLWISITTMMFRYRTPKAESTQ